MNKDKRILQRVDDVCATLHTTRAVVLYALLRGVLAGPHDPSGAKHTVVTAPDNETRAARAKAAIRKAMRYRRCETVRRLKQATNSKRIAVADWDKALKGLCNAGEMRVAEERTMSGRTRRVVILLKDVE